MRALVCICLMLSGCAGLPRETAIEEGAWQASHGFDAYQTSRFRSTPGTYEVESRFAIGREPAQGTVSAYFAGLALLHYAVTRYLVQNGPRWLTRTWEAVTLAWNVKDVRQNYLLGVR